MKTENRKKPPVHPGQVLSEGYLKENGITISEMAEALNISRNEMGSIVNGKKPVTNEIAIKLAKVVGNTPDVWIRLQSKYDFWYHQDNMPKKLKDHLDRFAKSFAKKAAL